MIEKARHILPGLVLTSAIALAAKLISSIDFLKAHLPLGPVMLAILLGIAVRNLVPVHGIFEGGIRFSFRQVLRLGVAGLGFALTFGEIVSVGVKGFLLDTLVILGTYLFARLLVRPLGLSQEISWLLATGTAICGASAVAAANSVVKAKDEEVAFAVKNVTFFGTLSMFLFPAIEHWMGFPFSVYGAWAGSSIHEVAQVIGATVNVSPSALALGTILKLTRVVFLLPVIILLEFLILKGRREKGSSSRSEHFPWFVVAFAIVVGINSMHLISQSVTSFLNNVDSILLAVAMAGLGLETRLSKVFHVGVAPVKAGVALWIFVSVLGLILSWAFYGTHAV
jgi:uncharacterized integral membrane protein (TIGR00698 family)